MNINGAEWASEALVAGVDTGTLFLPHQFLQAE